MGRKFLVWVKILGPGKNYGFGRKIWVWAILGLGKNFRFGRKFYVWVKILGLGKTLGLGENLGLGRKF